MPVGTALVPVTGATGRCPSHVRPEVFFVGQAVVSCQSRASSLASSACAGSRQLTTGSVLLRNQQRPSRAEGLFLVAPEDAGGHY